METVTQSVGISRLLKPPLDSDAPVAVFWDFENCHVPSDVDPDLVAGNIRAGLTDYGLVGPLSIRAYGNLSMLGRRVQVGLINSGVDVRDVPPDGKKETTDKRILTDLMLHACDTPPPAHILMVSGDEDFTYGLHRLALRCYHVHVAVNLESGLQSQPGLQRLTASGRAWQWQALIRGDVAPVPYTESLGVPTFAGGGQQRQSGIHERPVPVESSESTAGPASEADSADAGPWTGRSRSDLPHPIPSTIKDQVAAVLDSAPPRGISISQLQSFLARKGFTLDYRGLGYKQLLTMMQAMPDVVAVTVPAERSTRKKYLLRPAASPEFANSLPGSKTVGTALRAEVAIDLEKETKRMSDAKGGAEPADTQKKSEGDKKAVLEVQSNNSETESRSVVIGSRPKHADSEAKLKSVGSESRQRPVTSPFQGPFFRKVLDTIGGLLRRRPMR